MLLEQVSEILPSQFIEEDLKSLRARELFLKRKPAAQLAKLVTFFLGHNTERFAAEPVYGPTGDGYLESRGVKGLKADESLLGFFATAQGKSFIEDYRQEVIKSLATA